MAATAETAETLSIWQSRLEEREDEIVTREAEMEEERQVYLAREKEIFALEDKIRELDGTIAELQSRVCRLGALAESDSEDDEVSTSWREIARAVVLQRKVSRRKKRENAFAAEQLEAESAIIQRRTRPRAARQFVSASSILGSEAENTVDLTHDEGEIEGERVATQADYESPSEGKEASLFL